MARGKNTSLTASIRAREPRFECKPSVCIGAHANAPASAEYVSGRENLPDEVEPGVTYRNVAVRWRLAARLDDPEGPT